RGRPGGEVRHPEDDGAIKLRVVGEVNRAHVAGTQLLRNAIPAKLGWQVVMCRNPPMNLWDDKVCEVLIKPVQLRPLGLTRVSSDEGKRRQLPSSLRQVQLFCWFGRQPEPELDAAPPLACHLDLPCDPKEIPNRLQQPVLLRGGVSVKVPVNDQLNARGVSRS